MRTSIYKVTALSGISFLYVLNFAIASPSRYECLEKIGSSATKEQLDACINGNNIRTVQTSSSITSSEEASCIEMGFKRKTESFGNCVLELMGRRDAAIAGGDPDGATCIKYGFKPKSPEYASCRLQIDQARQQAQQNQATNDWNAHLYPICVTLFNRPMTPFAALIFEAETFGPITPFSTYSALIYSCNQLYLQKPWYNPYHS